MAADKPSGTANDYFHEKAEDCAASWLGRKRIMSKGLFQGRELRGQRAAAARPGGFAEQCTLNNGRYCISDNVRAPSPCAQKSQPIARYGAQQGPPVRQTERGVSKILEHGPMFRVFGCTRSRQGVVGRQMLHAGRRHINSAKTVGESQTEFEVFAAHPIIVTMITDRFESVALYEQSNAL
jgi:hypothetical protein